MVTRGAYYNEIGPFAAEWLRKLIKAGQIADGEVDTRSIEDVLPSDLNGFTQCHFFAGIGGWSYALRQAGWPDDRPVWTGSCPCQPFSAAGKGAGIADERHLWPAFFHLIGQSIPITVFGEQVASKNGLVWLDLVQADMENSGYSFGAVDTCSAGFGAPHIRQRLYWVANYESRGWREKLQPGRMGDANSSGLERQSGNGFNREEGTFQAGSIATANCFDTLDSGGRPGPTNGYWRDVDWLFCRDGKWRPVESIAEPLADGLADRLGYSRFGDRYSLNPLTEKAENKKGRLQGYGNSINVVQAIEFIKAYMEV